MRGLSVIPLYFMDVYIEVINTNLAHVPRLCIEQPTCNPQVKQM